MKLFLRIVAVLGVSLVLGALAVIWFFSSRERAWNDYISKLRKQGEKITTQELVASYSPSANHTFETLSNVIAQIGPAPGQISDGHLFQFVEPDRARIVWNLERPPGWSKNGNTNGSWAELRQQIDTAAPLLHCLHQTLGNPDPNCGARSNFFDTPEMWREQRSAVNWMAYETLGSLRAGNRAEAQTNIQAVAGLANLHREEGLMSIQMTRAAVAHIGIGLTWQALQLGNWSDEHLAALQHSWEAIDFLAGIERGMEGERELPVAIVQIIRRGELGRLARLNSNGAPLSSQCNNSSNYPPSVMYNDALFAFRQLQTKVELMRQLHGGESCVKVLKSLRELDNELEAKSHGITKILYVISLVTMPNFTGAVKVSARVETRRRLAVVAIALRRHELKHGRLPRTLAVLAPEFLRVVPGDCMNGQALKYRLNADGTFALYSVGLDGRDDGGDFRPIPGQLDTLDMVWPVNARPTGARPSEKLSR